MLKVEDYLQQLLSLVTPAPIYEVAVRQALGTVIAQDLTAKFAVPPFTNAAMDGFAMRSTDIPEYNAESEIANLSGNPEDLYFWLPVAGDIPAGDNHDYECKPGTCWRIMTGARLPRGADTVVKVEDTNLAPGDVPLPDKVQIQAKISASENVRFQGEDAQVGDLIMAAGELLTPAALASLVSVGYAQIPVRKKPKVAIISTGDELATPGQALTGAMIPDSNSVLLEMLCVKADAQVVGVYRSGDDPTYCRQILRKAASEAEIILTSGGVSAGAYDVIKQIGANSQLKFSKVAMQPGKPQGLGVWRENDGNEALIITLPGNPVSVFVSFHTFVRPVLAALSGQDPYKYLQTKLGTSAVGWKSPAGKRQFVPVSISEPHNCGGTPIVQPTHQLGSRSHFVASLHKANGLAVIPEDITEVKPWSVLEILPV